MDFQFNLSFSFGDNGPGTSLEIARILARVQEQVDHGRVGGAVYNGNGNGNGNAIGSWTIEVDR